MTTFTPPPIEVTRTRTLEMITTTSKTKTKKKRNMVMVSEISKTKMANTKNASQKLKMNIINNNKLEHKQRLSRNKISPIRLYKIKLGNFYSIKLRPSFTLISIFTLMINKWIVQTAFGQCPINTMTSFERVGGVTVKDSLKTVLYTAPTNISILAQQQSGLDLTRQLANAATLNIPITAECNNRCRRNIRCRAFLVDYERHTCYSIEHPASNNQVSQTSLVRTPQPIYLIPTLERTAYFEKICLNLPLVECERAWVYERVMAHHIYGNDDKIIEEVPSRLKCQEHCLNEREFKCRSGEYDYVNMQCRLSKIDRHIKPTAFKPTTNSVDYFENQCIPVGNQCDAFDRYEDMDLGRAEIMRNANTSDQCQQMCTQTIKAFICRSFTWSPITGKCYLNSANSFMVGGLDKLISAPGLIYYQRNDCIDLKLECDPTQMILNLRTVEPFRGRMYVRDDPNSCETLGRSSLISSLNIPFQSNARCATKELPSRYSSVVVVQQHPLIQRKTDRYIKVVCDFQTANKTITSTYNVNNNPWTSTALINATSFAPKIRLRITDKFGLDITGAKLGDELNLRIEAETDSPYDMVARSVLAKSGTTEESIALIDKDGCPTDFRIFPPLRKLNRRTIIGKFDAFKFSSDVVVRFQVDVQFCLNQCPLTSCDQSILLNSNPSQLAEAYSANGLTTMSPQILPSAAIQDQASLIPAPVNNPTISGSSSSSSSSTQPPVPFQQRTSSDILNSLPHHLHHSNHLGANNVYYNHRNNYTTSNSPYHDQTVTGTYGPQSNSLSEPGIYYNSVSSPAPSSLSSSSSSSTLNNNIGRHSSMSLPSNMQPGDFANFTNSHSILDSLVTPAGDPQIFDPSHNLRNAPSAKFAPDSIPGSNKARDQRQQQQTNSISQSNDASTETANLSPESSNDLLDNSNNSNNLYPDQRSNSARRRRRSNEFIPQSPRHVPLQREIIVESSPGPPSSSNGRQSSVLNGRNISPSSVSSSSSSASQVSSSTTNSYDQHKPNKDFRRADGRNGPTYDVNGKFVFLFLSLFISFISY